MADFTVRVELHGASGDDYETLHTRMEMRGFRRFIYGVNEKGVRHKYQLPTAEYDFTSESSAEDIRNTVKTIADAVRPNAWVLVTKETDRSWHLRIID